MNGGHILGKQGSSIYTVHATVFVMARVARNTPPTFSARSSVADDGISVETPPAVSADWPQASPTSPPAAVSWPRDAAAGAVTIAPAGSATIAGLSFPLGDAAAVNVK